MRFIYNLFVHLYTFSVRIAAPFNEKAGKWIMGRKNVFVDLQNSDIADRQVIWVHTASLGEFEQGRPIIEKLKINYPDHKILLTFFSPSGYEIRKNYDLADYVCYLPADTISNARKFVKIVNPELVVFIKYEFWYNYIFALYKKKTPLIFASVIFRPSQHFFQLWGRWFVQQLNRITYIFVQNQESLLLLDKIGINHAEVAGDTRFDRVVQLPEEDKSFPIVEKFKGTSKVIMGGSTWQPGEAILLDIIEKNDFDIKLVIAPHIISAEHIADIKNRFSNYNPVLYSKGESEDLVTSKVLIIDKIGFLSLLYRYADIAYIGGGFGVGLHNVLEASTYGIPVLFGPNHLRFREAVELKNNGGGFFINNSHEASDIVDKLLKDVDFYKKSSEISLSYVKENSGATQKVINKVKEYIIAG